MKKAVGIFFLLFTLNLWAEAGHVTVYFLSRPDQVTLLQNYIQNHMSDQTLWSRKLVQSPDDFKKNCTPMGDGCFHPQLGYIEDPEAQKAADSEPVEAAPENPVQMKTINSEEVDLVECDKGYYFDLYCGEARKKKAAAEAIKKPADVEFWIDTSSSLLQVDYSSDNMYCERRRIVSVLKSECKANVNFSVFNTSKKRLSTLDNLCVNYGTNDGSRMVDWLKDSEAKNVVIITDTDEYVGEFREYLDSIRADIIGIGVKPIVATQLYEMKDEFLGLCQ